MTKRKTATGKGEAKKLKLKKETIRDLDVRGTAPGVRGGLGGKPTKTIQPTVGTSGASCRALAAC